MKVTIELDEEMAAWLQSPELGEQLAGHIGGNAIPDIADRIIHMLDVSPYQAGRSRSALFEVDADGFPIGQTKTTNP